MNWDRTEGNWKPLRVNVEEQWGGLTDNRTNAFAGQRGNFAGKIQERFGITKDEMEQQVTDWESRMKGNRMKEMSHVK